MTKLKISMAVSALTITLAPQVSAYATDQVQEAPRDRFLQTAMVVPMLSEPVDEGYCAMSIEEMLREARDGRLQLPSDSAELACLEE